MSLSFPGNYVYRMSQNRSPDCLKKCLWLVFFFFFFFFGVGFKLFNCTQRINMKILLFIRYRYERLYIFFLGTLRSFL